MSTSDPKLTKRTPVVVKDARRGTRRRVLPSPGTNDLDRERDQLRLQVEAELEARYAAGVRDGRAQVEAEMRPTLVAAVSDLEGQAAALRAAGRRQVLDLERAVIDLVLQISRKVLDRDIQARPDVAFGILRHALIAVADQEVIAIRVSPESIATFRHGVTSLGDVIADPAGVNWVPDRRVPPGGAVVETEAGKIDATIEAQVDEAARVLHDILDGQHA